MNLPSGPPIQNRWRSWCLHCGRTYEAILEQVQRENGFDLWLIYPSNGICSPCNRARVEGFLGVDP